MCPALKGYNNGNDEYQIEYKCMAQLKDKKTKKKKEIKDEYQVSLVELPPVKPRLSRRQSPAALVSDERT